MPNLQKIKLLRQLKANPALALLRAFQELEEKLEKKIDNFFQKVEDRINNLLQRIENIKREVAIITKELKTIAESDKTNILEGITQIKGEIGLTGLRGEKGDSIIGKQGLRGLQGLLGHSGAIGGRGERGLIGKSGRDGIDGQNGRDGKPAIFPKKEFKDFKKEVRELFEEQTKKLKRFGGHPQRGGGLDFRKVLKYQSLVGDVNGVNTSFTLPSTPISPDTVEIFANGQQQKPTTNFSVSGITITFTSAPPAGFDLWAHYLEL